jgi:CRP-like cAMP-binding protein
MQELQQTFAELDFSAPQDFIEKMYDGLKNKSYQPNNLICCEAKKMDYLLFIRSGKIKCSYRDEDEEIVLCFIQAHELIALSDSIPGELRPTIRLEVIDPCEISCLTRHQWEMLSKEYPIHCLLLEIAILKAASHHLHLQAAILRHPTIGGKLTALRHFSPSLYAGLTHGMKASFLGVHQQSISRHIGRKNPRQKKKSKSGRSTK